MTAPINPFVGLRSFEPGEGRLFFGRDALIGELLRILYERRFVAVVGGSGCGKSSLVRAGLLPQIEGAFIVQERDRWKFVTVMPGSAPLGTLIQGILGLEEPTAPVDQERVVALHSQIQICAEHAFESTIATTLGDACNLMIVVDQFEELFRFAHITDPETVDPDERERCQTEAALFVDTLLGLTRMANLPVYVVLTMRSDAIGLCETFRGLPEAVGRSLFLVPRLPREEQRKAIVGPVRLVGGDVDPQLVERLLNDSAGEADRLPVLQHALRRTWEVWQESGAQGSVLEKHYRDAGTIASALERDATAALDRTGNVLLAQRVFQALTVTDAGKRMVRRPTPRSILAAICEASPDEVDGVVEPFLERSLVRNIASAGEPKYDLTHESLIPLWPKLASWVAEEAEAAEVYGRLVMKARLWKQDREDVWTKPEQPQFVETEAWWSKRRPTAAWAAQYGGDFDLAWEFLRESRGSVRRELDKRRRDAVAHVERERQKADTQRREAERQRALAERDRRQKEREARRNLGWAITTGIVLAFAWLALVVAIFIYRTAHNDRTVTVLLGQARDEAQLPRASLVFASAAYQREQSPETFALLANQIMSSGGRGILSDDAIKQVQVAEDGKAVLTLENGGHVHTYDLESAASSQVRGTADAYSDAALGRTLLAMAHRDGEVSIAPRADPARASLLPRPPGSRGITAVALAPGERQLIGSDADGRVWLWSLNSGAQSSPKWVADFGSPIVSIRVAEPRESLTWLLVVSLDKRAHLYAVGPDTQVEQTQQFSEVTAADLSSDGRWLALSTMTASKDAPPTWTEQLWKLPATEPRTMWFSAPFGEFTLPVDQNRTGAVVSSLAVAPRSVDRGAGGEEDGVLVASGSSGGQIRLWNGGKEERSLDVGDASGVVRIVRLSADGRWLAAASQYAPIQLWDLSPDPWSPSARAVRSTGQPWLLRGHDQPVESLAFAPDGRYLVSASRDKTLHVWTLTNASPASEYLVHHSAQRDPLGPAERLTQVVFSTDGRLQVAGTGAGRVEVLDFSSSRGAFTLPTRQGFSRAPVDSIRVIQGSNGNVHIAGLSSVDRQLTVWTLTPGSDGRLDSNALPSLTNDVTAIASNRSGELAVAMGSSIVVRDLNKAAPLETISIPWAVDRLDFSVDGRLLLVSSYPRDTGTTSVGANASLVIREPSGPSHVRDLLTAASGCGPGGALGRITMAAISRDNRWLAIGTNTGGWVWELGAVKPCGARPLSLEDVSGRVSAQPSQGLIALAFDATSEYPAARLLTAADDGAVRIFNLAQEELTAVRTYSRPASRLVSLSASNDGKWWFFGGRDGTVQLWRADALPDPEGHPSLLREPSAGADAVVGGTFATSASGTRWLVTVTESGLTRKWPLDGKELLVIAERQAAPSDDQLREIKDIESTVAFAFGRLGQITRRLGFGVGTVRRVFQSGDRVAAQGSSS